MFGIRLHLPLFEQVEVQGLLRMAVTSQGRHTSITAGVYAPGGTDDWSHVIVLGFKNNVLFTESTKVEDLVESTFHLYYGLTPSWTPVYPGLPGNPGLYTTFSPPWHVDTDPAGEALCGIVICDSATGLLALAGVTFQEPIVLRNGLLLPVSILIT